jgi:hypothetical protein
MNKRYTIRLVASLLTAVMFALATAVVPSGGPNGCCPTVWRV